MDKVIFCPDESFLEEAKKLSHKYICPILIGDNQRTKNLSFDRSSVIPLAIPTDNFVHFSKKVIFVNEPFTVEYFNDFINFNDELEYVMLSERIGHPNGYFPLKPFIVERHKVSFKMICQEEDTYTVFVKYKKEDVDFKNAINHFTFNVIEKGN